MSTNKTPNLGLHSWVGTDRVLREEFNENFNKLDTVVPGKTAAGLTYYVDAAAGNDTNDGLTSGTALKTIGAAIDKLPQVINHAVTINLAAGTYAETINIQGYIGKGSISLIGGNVVGDSHIISALNLLQCQPFITVKGIRAASTTAHGFNIGMCNAEFENCKCIDDTTATFFNGFNVYGGSSIVVKNSLISNRYTAISAWGSRVYNVNNTGTGNLYAIGANEASIVGISGTQPEGTNGNIVNNGSMIDGETPASIAHLAESATQAHKAKNILVEDTGAHFTSNPKNIENVLTEVFTNVSNGKIAVGGAITDVDPSVVIPADPTFADLVTAIGQISTGKKWATGTTGLIGYTYESPFYVLNIAVSGLAFTPTQLLLIDSTVYSWVGSMSADLINVAGTVFPTAGFSASLYRDSSGNMINTLTGANYEGKAFTANGFTFKFTSNIAASINGYTSFRFKWIAFE